MKKLSKSNSANTKSSRNKSVRQDQNIKGGLPYRRPPKYDLPKSSLFKFKFNDQDRNLLKVQGIAEDFIIAELEQVIISEYSLLTIDQSIRDRTLSAKQERNFIDKLKSSVKGLLNDLGAVRKLPMEFQVLLTDGVSPFFRLREELNAFEYHLNRIPLYKGSAGRKDKYDLGYLVLEVAKLMYRYDITVSGRGKQFTAILNIIFKAIGEDKRQIRNAVKYAWPDIEKLTQSSS